jgi:hypothetical protein
MGRATNSPKRQADALGFLALTYRELRNFQQVLTLRLQMVELVRANRKVLGDDEPYALQSLAGQLLSVE